MEVKIKQMYKLIGWFLIALLIPTFGMVLEYVQAAQLPLSLGAFLLSLIGFLAILLERLIKLFFELEGESLIESPPA